MVDFLSPITSHETDKRYKDRRSLTSQIMLMAVKTHMTSLLPRVTMAEDQEVKREGVSWRIR